MIREIEAVYQNGILRPLESLSLAENQQVRVLVEEIPIDPCASMIDVDFLAKATAAASHGSVPTLAEIQRRTAQDTSSWAELIAAGREERF
jgi:predicted DNA-binding antitoxin AbrB/MazE fold protein